MRLDRLLAIDQVYARAAKRRQEKADEEAAKPGAGRGQRRPSARARRRR